jgi:hypothetical protein
MRSHVVIGVFALTLAACAATLRVDSDFDASVDFGHYRSFAWIREDPLIQSAANPARVSPLNQRRIQLAIESELLAKGFTLSGDRAAADFVVSYTVGSRDKIDVVSYPTPFVWNGRWGGAYYGHELDVRPYREGQLAIDVFDGATHQPVWHGSATKRISESDRQNAKAQIDAAVAAILARFPPHLPGGR